MLDENINYSGKVYIIEYIAKGFLRKFIRFVTNKKYIHTSMFIDSYHCDLSPGIIEKKLSKFDYRVEYISNSLTGLVKDLVERNKTVDIFEVPHNFTITELKNMISWWKSRNNSNKKYGFRKLFVILFNVIYFRILKYFSRWNKKPYKLFWDVINEDVCSIAVDECLREAGNYDILPEYNERLTYPGLFAEKLKKYKVCSVKTKNKKK